MDQRTYNISTTISHRGKSSVHHNSVQSLIKKVLLPEVLESRNEWHELIKSVLDHPENTHIWSTHIYFDGTSYAEVIKAYPPDCPEIEFSFFLHTHGALDFWEHQSTAEFKDMKRHINEQMPEFSYRMTHAHQLALIECYNRLLDLARDKKLEFKLGGVSNSQDENIGLTISFRDNDLRETSVKFGGVVTGRGNVEFKAVRV